MNVETTTYGSLLIPVLNERIPDDLRMVISRKFGARIWTMDEMLQYFNEELQAKERCVSYKKPDDTRERRNKSEKLDEFSAANLHSQSERKNDRNTISKSNFGKEDDRKCVYCGNSQVPSRCKIVTNPLSRIAILRRKARCFLCLNFSHRAYECPSKYECAKCGKRHHISICKERNEKREVSLHK